MKNYLQINRNNWNQRLESHLNSNFYDMPSFLAGKSSLKSIEQNLLGDVKNLELLHLQCHFGQDTLSLARLGAKVTGIDLANQAIAKAKSLADELELDAEFHCCDVYDTPQTVQRQFDLVFTSYGTIGWLPDIKKWASVINQCMKPGGRFIMAEFHPVVWMFDDDFQKVTYRYFNDAPIAETETGTYADREADLEQDFVCWNHGLAEVTQALIDEGLSIKQFQEFDYSPYPCFEHLEKIDEDQYRIKHLVNKIPMVYALECLKPLP